MEREGTSTVRDGKKRKMGEMKGGKGRKRKGAKEWKGRVEKEMRGPTSILCSGAPEFLVTLLHGYTMHGA